MELRQIRYFVAVAEEGNFSAASRRLFVSQPPITRQIQQLEAELEVRLFERTQKGVTLTAAGEAFLAEARQILSRTRLAAERSRSAEKGEVGRLEIGYFGSAIYSIIPELVRRFCQGNPGATISLAPINKKDQINAIKDGGIHVGFGRYYPPAPGVEIEIVTRERLVLAISTTHPYANRKTVNLEQLQRENMIVFPREGRPSFADEVVRIVRQTGHEPNIEHEAPDLSTALALTAAGMGVAPVPESVTQLNWPNLRFLTMRNVKTVSPVNCIYSTDNQSPLLLRFLETVRAYSRG